MSEILPEQEIEWSDLELKAAVEAYLWMLEQETINKPYKKSIINKSLREGILSKRSRGSIEYRMQNISATLLELCHPWIQGYKPHANIGQGVKRRIVNILDELKFLNSENYIPVLPSQTLDNRVYKLRQKKLIGTPKGNALPRRIDIQSFQYVRDPIVKAWILQCAMGKCELCGQSAPFVTDDGFPYLEVHHVVSLAEGGADKVDNAIAVCPNCHKRCHLSKDRKDILESLYKSINRLARFCVK